MMIVRDCSAVALLIVVNIASVLCAEGKSDEQSVKNKRDASIGSFSYVASDISKVGSHVKTVTVLKNIEVPSATDAFTAFSMINTPQRKGKTTVEYWPPDMDKEKFYSMKKGSAIVMWPEKNKQVVQVINHNQQLPEKLADIPVDVAWTPADISDYQPLLGPTEVNVIDTVSITDPGPVVFPTLEPTTKSPDRAVVFIPRTGHKKRKLKKKAKNAPTVPFVETSFVPYSNSVTETMASGQHIADATPIYENVDESYVNYQPRYTDVISNLSNLTEMTFGERNMNRTNNNGNNLPIINVTFGDNDLLDNTNVTSSANGSGSDNGMNATVEMNKASPNSFMSLTPLEKQLNQLKRAIDERDIAKIKNIVMSMEEPKMEKISVSSTTEVVTMEASTQAVTQPTTLASTTVRNKIYLAPRVRNAQKKANMTVSKSLTDEKQLNITSSSTTGAETFTFSLISSMFSSTFKSLTTENTTEVAKINSTVPVRKGRNITPRVKSSAGRSRHATKNNSRRVNRKPS